MLPNGGTPVPVSAGYPKAGYGSSGFGPPSFAVLEQRHMVTADASTTIARPVEQVYDFVILRFFENYPRWAPEVVELEPLGPSRVEVGTRGRQVRVDRGRRSDTTFVLTALEPGRFARFDAEGRPYYSIRFWFAELGENSTRLTLEFSLLRVEFYMRPFESLIRRAVRAGTERTVEDIRELLEGHG